MFEKSALAPFAVFEPPVVFERSALTPFAVFEFPIARISLLTAPKLFNKLIVALPAVICLIDKTIVPLKSEVGVITSVPVVVTLGPMLPVAVIPPLKYSPNPIVKLPAVLPVTVYVI